MNLWQRLRSWFSSERMSLDDYVGLLSTFSYNGVGYAAFGSVQQTLADGKVSERVPQDYIGFCQAAYSGNGIVFACMLARLSVFSAVRFSYQRFNKGKPSELWGDGSLRLLEEPWAGGTTQDLLARLIQDADLAGNAYSTVGTSLATLGGDGGQEIIRLRPDWVDVVLAPRYRRGGQLGWQKFGYLYTEDGYGSGSDPVPLLLDEVAHFAPNPDPLASYRGMSWLTPIIREVQSDGLMNRHKRKFFENGATPNMIIKHPPEVSPEKVREFKERLDYGHKGVENAYRTLHIGGGADATVVGADFQQIDFKTVQGAGETRIAAAAGVPPVVVGLSEGLQGSSLNAGNWGQARRRFADGTQHPLWANVAGSMQRIVPAPPGSRLWYDARNVPFLREDEKDAAEILFVQAQTMRQLIDAGYKPDSVQQMMLAGGDIGLLEHSNLYSVQLQAAGSQAQNGQVPVLTGAGQG